MERDGRVDKFKHETQRIKRPSRRSASGRLCETWEVDEDLEGSLHHVELWVPSLERAREECGWILTSLGYSPDQNWDQGISWRRGTTYIVAEESPALSGT